MQLEFQEHILFSKKSLRRTPHNPTAAVSCQGHFNDTLLATTCPLMREKLIGIRSRRMSPFIQLVRLLRAPWHDRLNLISSAFVLLKTSIYYRHVCAHVGRGSRIYKPLLLSNPRFVTIGERTLIRPGARIEAIVLDEKSHPAVIIGSNVNIEQNLHLVCSSRIAIGDNVSIAPNCCLLDTSHPYRDVEDPRKIGDRLNTEPTPIQIGENTLIGFGVVILPNVSIGKHCVIGANSTLRRDVPDYCVVAGNPATIILRYDLEHKIWK